MAVQLSTVSLRKVALLSWLLACLAALVFAYAHQGQSETTQGFAIVMAFLTFPSGLGLGMIVIDLLGSVYPQGFAGNLIFWGISVVGGYLQWFVFVPWFFKRRSAAI
jgi:hypothetical protein